MTGLSEKEFYNKYPDQQSFMMEYGGIVEQYKKGGWIQKATASIKRRGTEGVCTGSKFGGPTCPPGSKRYNLAKTFRKMAKARKKEEGGYVDMYAEGGKLPEGILRARLESHMSPGEAQDYINNYAQGGVVDAYQLMGMPTPSMYGMGGYTMNTAAESTSTAGAQAQARFMYDKAMQLPDRGIIYATPDAVHPNDYALATMSGYTGSNPGMVRQAANRAKKQVAPMAAAIAGAPLLSSSMATVGNLLARPFINTPGLSWLNANKVLDAHMLHAFADRAPEWTAAFEKAYASGSEKDLEELAKITTLQAIDVSPVLEIGHLKSAPAAMKKIVDILSPFAKTSKLVTEGKGSAKVAEHTLKEGTKYQADTTKKRAMGGPIMYKTGGNTSGPFEETDLEASSMQGMSIGQIKKELKNNSEKAQRNVLKYDLDYTNSLKNVLTPEEKFKLGLVYNRKLGNWDIGATGKVDYNRTINPESKSSVIQRNVNLGVTGGYQGPGGSSLSGEVNYNPITKTWGGSAKGSITFKEGGPVMYGMGDTTNIGDLSHVISRKNFPNMGYAMGGPVMYKKGGFLTGLKDYGLALADTATSVVNPDIIGADSYSDTGFGNTMKGFSDITGGFTNAAAPIVAGAFLGPVGSAAVSTAQNMSNQFVPQRQDNSTTRQIGNMFESLAPLGGAIYAASANSTPKTAMGGQVNYPQGLRKNMGNMPIFAMGGMTGPLTEINVERGELLTDKDGRIVTEYKGGGMVPHPEEGMDERGTVPAQEGMFVITKAMASKYKAAMKNKDKQYADAIRNNIAFRKARKEAKEEAEASKMMAKYGGAIQRMMARGGMVPMYDDGAGVTGGLNSVDWSDILIKNPAFKNNNFSFSTPNTAFSGSREFLSTPSSLNLDHTPMTMGQYLTGQEGSYMDYRNIPDTGIGYTAGKTTNTPGGDMSNFGKYAPYAMQGLPIAWNLMQSMKKPTKVPGTLGAMSTALEAPKMSGEAGRRALAREGAAARYAWRQAGAQAGPATLTAMTNARMGRIADFEEGLRNTQAQMDYQAAAQRKAYEQFNAQQAMNRYMLQAQADAVPTQYASAGMGQLGQMGESILNRQALNQLYPKS